MYKVEKKRHYEVMFFFFIRSELNLSFSQQKE